MEHFFLNSNKSKQSINERQVKNLSFKSNFKILPNDALLSTISANDVYKQERANCNKFRINIAMNTICSNVLFNLCTEIVQNEGSDNACCLNFSDFSEGQGLNAKLYGKKTIDNYNDVESNAHVTSNIEGATRVFNGIEDTQISNQKCNYKYHCGLDFFNNHLLRNQTFKVVNNNKLDDSEHTKVFNTLSDFHRDYNGNVIKDETFTSEYIIQHSHLYKMDDVLTFQETVKDKIVEDNGWFGFYNKTNLKIFNDNELLDIAKPLNNHNACEFVDLYPTRDLYSFIPKYNEHRKRIEKNWNYCLTYPSSSTPYVPFINPEVDGGALRLFLIDDTLSNNEIKCYSMSKHGLQVGDYVNIYSGTNITLSTVEVSKLEDEFTFYIDKRGKSINSNWEMVDEQMSTKDYYEQKQVTSYLIYKNGNRFYNSNANMMTFSFKKITNNIENQYYVRIFSRIPNWKFADKKITEKLIYEENRGYIREYQTYQTEFSSSIGKLGFSKNIYGDDIAEIVYHDDIDLSYLRDNLGRPLTEIALTVVKNNKGYEKWYGDGHNVTDEDVEFSHCFGKVNCGFELNPNMNDIFMDCYFKMKNSCLWTRFSNSHLISNQIYYNGLDQMEIDEEIEEGEDEIFYERTHNFYGDLCTYSPSTFQEDVIEEVDYRFNTAQREMLDPHNGNLFTLLRYHNIKHDDFEGVPFELECFAEQIGLQHEGYIYHPHFKIPIHSWSEELETQAPKSFGIRRVKGKQICTSENNYLEKGDKFLIYNKDSYSYQTCTVTEVISLREFKFREITGNHDPIVTNDTKNHYRILKPDATIPNYANFLTDGSCSYIWRNFVHNGFEYEDNTNEVYPFTNGRIYVTKSFNLFLRRQNPSNTNALTNYKYNSYKIDGNFIPQLNKNNFYNENQIRC